MPAQNAPPAGGGPTAPAPPWAELSGTQRAIVLALLRHGRLSRPQIMSLVGISPGSVTRLTAPLVEQGLLTTRPERASGAGRPPSPLELRADAESLVGVSVSARTLTAVLTDLRLNVLETARRPLPGHDPRRAAGLLADVVGELLARRPAAPAPSCLGLSLGGTSRDGRTVDEAVFLGWHGVPLAAAIEARTGLPTRVGNDLTALTQHEAWFGAGRDHERFALVTVGAGVGYGLVVDGGVITSPDAELGLLGTIPVPDGARPPVASPAMDCLTDTALERAWAAAGGGPARAEAIVRRAADGDRTAVAVCASFARRLGRLIGMLAAFTLPEVVVVAGERAAVASLFEEQVMVGIAAVRRASARSPTIAVREHERVDWARGAACLALRSRVMGEL